MKVEIKIPTMGESVSEAIVSNILKPSGSFVSADEEILELETDKVNQVLYAPQAGQLTLNVKQDDTVKVGQIIGFVETEVKEPKASVKEVKPVPPPSASTPSPALVKPSAGGARKMAEEFAKELKTPVSQQSTTVSSPLPPKQEPLEEGKVTRKRMSNLRRMIAARLVEAKNTTAMLTTFNEVDMSGIMEIRAREKDKFQKHHGVKLGMMSFFIKGVVGALKAIPEVNAYIDGDEIVTVHTFDIGVAVSTEKGLMVPVLRGCDQLNFAQIEAGIEEFANKARSGKIAVDDLRGGSFTITNGGRFGSLLSTPILNPPQSAILGMHAIVERPVAVNKQVVIRPMMYLALSYDHRIIDGKEAVLFLVHLKELLEDPARLLLD
jgi:2-oxoglutarate dehydrogenase E2 component (dihydrolipoamide succinyltransferase)